MKTSPYLCVPLKDIAWLFFKLGAISFGGPAAHIALMRAEVVQRRKWISEEQFLDYLGATHLIPGPNSTELAIHIGHHLRGYPGLLIAGSCFIIPAMVIVWGLAWGYVAYGSLPELNSLLYGIKPVVIAIVFQALWGLSRSAVKSWPLAALGGLSLALTILGMNEVFVLFLSGAISLFWLTNKQPPLKGLLVFVASMASKAFAASPLAGATTVGLTGLFVNFVKIGSVLFGSGYVLLAFLRADFVERLGWLTEAQLLDAIAVGQFTPGPVFTTATFVGYLIAGNMGALVATLGIFLPAFIFVALTAPLISKLRHSMKARAFLDGVNVASMALMLTVLWQLGRNTFVDIPTLSLALFSGLALLRYRINSAWLILAGAGLGYLLKIT